MSWAVFSCEMILTNLTSTWHHYLVPETVSSGSLRKTKSKSQEASKGYLKVLPNCLQAVCFLQPQIFHFQMKYTLADLQHDGFGEIYMPAH